MRSPSLKHLSNEHLPQCLSRPVVVKKVVADVALVAKNSRLMTDRLPRQTKGLMANDVPPLLRVA